MDYNATRPTLVMPEYGRAVQQMAEFLLTIEDPESRLKHAQYVVDTMAILNPAVKNTDEYRHMLWDHLYQITAYKLEVEGPYPKPDPAALEVKPTLPAYPDKKVKSRHLGKNLQHFLQAGLENEDPSKHAGFVQHIGYYMKLAYATWHKEPMHDEAIAKELRQLSDGKMEYEPGGYRVHVDRNSPAGNNNFKQERPNKKYKGGYGSSQGGNAGGGFKKKFRKKNG